MVVAPATANMIGKLANGIADDALSTFMLAVTSPKVICPSMNTHMYQSRAVQRNLDHPESRRPHRSRPGGRRTGLRNHRPRTACPDPADIADRARGLPDSQGLGRKDRPGERRPDPGADRPGAFHQQSVFRQDGICPWPGPPNTGGRASCWSPVRPTCRTPLGVTGGACSDSGRDGRRRCSSTWMPPTSS